MPKFHQQTKHSYQSVRKNPSFLDWRTQPKNFKIYPHFQQRFKIDKFDELKDLNLIGGITYEKEYPDGKYYLRVNPSAGALYPCEVYIQIRGVQGILNGIYHYEPLNASLTLLNEVEDDGVEFYFKDKLKQQGFIFLISSIYFRSSWKYRDRSIRYIFLDSGHQLGSIYAMLHVKNRDSKIVFEFDKLSLNEEFGFRDDEAFNVAICSTRTKDKESKKLKQTIPFVSGCDYLETNKFIENAYKESAAYSSDDIVDLNFFADIPSEVLKTAIANRRSIRAFRGTNILKEEFEFITKDIFSLAKLHKLDIYYTAHRIDNFENGLYKEDELLKSGDFSDRSRYLSLEQSIGGESAVTFYFTSSEISSYQKVNILSGFLAHIIYLKSQIKGIGCTGIGAYYDDETKQFLGTGNNVLYFLAIGR
jgi:SagB-type dehydrogenase family enzyme